MGTRALIHVRKGNATLLTVYKQFDGYPSGLGADIKRILGGTKLVNGFTPRHEDGNHHNGMGCLAATLIKKLKEGIGNVYVYEPNSKGCGEEFIYTIYAKDGIIHLTLTLEYSKEIGFDGPIDDFNPGLLEETL